MRVLLVTGMLAKDTVEHYSKQVDVDTIVIALPVPVASLLTPEYIARSLQQIRLDNINLILVPGQVIGDVAIIEKTIGIPTFKGSRYAADLPIVLSSLGKVRLSKLNAADDVITEIIQEKVRADLKESYEGYGTLLSQPGSFLLGNLPIGKGFPMRVMAEILGAPLLSDNELRRISAYYLHSGAHIIDVGMLTGKSRPSDAARAVRVIKAEFNVPVAIDTFNLEEAEAAISAGVDMLLSLDASNLNDASRFAKDLAVVVIPGDHTREPVKEASRRIASLAENVAAAKRAGFKKIVADPILDALINPGMMESLISYRAYSTQYPDVPLLFGAGNITELIDADSIGVNALLAGLASELGVNILLTTEGSPKTYGCINELATATKMMWIAKRRLSVPKDLGLDMLVLKEKRRIEEPLREDFSGNVIAVRVNSKSKSTPPIDPQGYFRIAVDRERGQITVIHFSEGKATAIFKGRDASSICSTILECNLITRLDHAAYLGNELAKAEIALRTGRSYVQDAPLFTSKAEGILHES
ncbi:MAG: dihydropteroate synthase-like protein [Candidatus Bathyarchaeia archaeon]